MSLEANNIAFSYSRNQRVLENVSASVRQPEPDTCGDQRQAERDRGIEGGRLGQRDHGAGQRNQPGEPGQVAFTGNRPTNDEPGSQAEHEWNVDQFHAEPGEFGYVSAAVQREGAQVEPDSVQDGPEQQRLRQGEIGRAHV